MKSMHDLKNASRCRKAGWKATGSFPGALLSSISSEPTQDAKGEVGKWRLILNLSSSEGLSVNDGIKRELCSLSHMSVDDMAKRLMNWEKGHLRQTHFERGS